MFLDEIKKLEDQKDFLNSIATETQQQSRDEK